MTTVSITFTAQERLRFSLIDLIRTLVTMNDKQFVEFAVAYGDRVEAYAALMTLVADGAVIMSSAIDAAGRKRGGVYSLPSSAQVVTVDA